MGAHSGQPTMAAPGTSDFKDGDWICARCGDHQFARNPGCRRCGAARPTAVPSAEAVPPVPPIPMPVQQMSPQNAWANYGGALAPALPRHAPSYKPKYPSDPNVKLRRAVMNDDREAFLQALNCGGSDEGRDGAGKCVLHYAARGGQLWFLHQCLERGFDPNAKDLYGTTVVDEAEYWSMKYSSNEERQQCLQCRNLLAVYGGRRGDSVDMRRHRVKLENLLGRDGRDRFWLPWHEDLSIIARRWEAMRNDPNVQVSNSWSLEREVKPLLELPPVTGDPFDPLSSDSDATAGTAPAQTATAPAVTPGARSTAAAEVPQATPNGALDYGNYYSTWADPAVFQRVSAELRDRHLAWQAKKQPWSGDYAPITPLDPNNHVYKF